MICAVEFCDTNHSIYPQQAEKLNAWKDENEVNKKVKEANQEKIKKDEIKLAKCDLLFTLKNILCVVMSL